MRWPWTSRPEPRHAWSPPAPIPDGDRVLAEGQPHWSDLLTGQPTASGDQVSRAAFVEPTRSLPLVSSPPLLTPAAWWRHRSRRSAAW